MSVSFKPLMTKSYVELRFGELIGQKGGAVINVSSAILKKLLGGGLALNILYKHRDTMFFYQPGSGPQLILSPPVP